MNGMTLDAAIEALEEARDELGGDALLRVAWQENYPLRGAVTGIKIPGSPDAADLYDEGSAAAGQDQDGRFCWLATEPPDAPENPYGPDWAWSR